MKKIISIIMAMTVVCTMCFGCGSSGNESQGSNAEDGSEVAETPNVKEESEKTDTSEGNTAGTGNAEAETSVSDASGSEEDASAAPEGAEQEEDAEATVCELGDTISTDIIEITVHDADLAFYASSVEDDTWGTPLDEDSGGIFTASKGNVLLCLNFDIRNTDRTSEIVGNEEFPWELYYVADDLELPINAYDLNEHDGISGDINFRTAAVTYHTKDESWQTFANDSNNLLLEAGDYASVRVIGIVNTEPQSLEDSFKLKIVLPDSSGEKKTFIYNVPQGANGSGTETGEIDDPGQGQTGAETSEEAEKSGDTEEKKPKKMTSKKLEKRLLKEPLRVISTQYTVQDDEYKALYPDMLTAILENGTDTDIKDAVVAFVGWDENNLPVKIRGQFDYSGETYVKEVNCADINLAAGQTFGDSYGFALDEECKIANFKAIAVSYVTFEGETWRNPYYDEWVKMYEGVKYKEKLSIEVED